jgi:hypothetical protein
VKLCDCRLGDEPGRARFTDTGDEAAAVAGTGAREIEVVPLDQAIAPDGPLPFVKLDVEGSEAAALRGAQRLLERARPMLAISVYHRPDDPWEIPRHLASLDLGYRLILRTHGWDGMDLVLYALPR